jgi:hypothetical protein
LLALAGLTGSLYLSIGMGLKACPLCFYQRTFVMAVGAVLVIGWFLTLHQEVLCMLALPLAAGGLGVAVFHLYLEFAGKLECPQGILSLGTAPQQSFALFALLFAALLGGTLMLRRFFLIAVRIVLGAALAATSIWSAPPDGKRSITTLCGATGDLQTTLCGKVIRPFGWNYQERSFR